MEFIFAENDSENVNYENFQFANCFPIIIETRNSHGHPHPIYKTVPKWVGYFVAIVVWTYPWKQFVCL